jgi:hypothetical protein
MQEAKKTAATLKYALIGCVTVVIINAIVRGLFRINNDGVTVLSTVAVSLLVTYLFVKSEQRAPTQTERLRFLWQYGLLLGILFLVLFVVSAKSPHGSVWFPVTLAVHWLVYLIGAYLIFSARFINKYLQELLATSVYAHVGRVPDTGVAALDYDKSISLDAESLAEQGVKRAYEEMLPLLSSYIAKPEPIVETVDSEALTYAVSCQGKTYEIYNPKTERESWRRATYALFSIINDQLGDKPVKFYAINGGNDLLGMFLTQEEYTKAITALGPDNKQDWPYFPTLEP